MGIDTYIYIYIWIYIIYHMEINMLCNILYDNMSPTFWSLGVIEMGYTVYVYIPQNDHVERENDVNVDDDCHDHQYQVGEPQTEASFLFMSWATSLPLLHPPWNGEYSLPPPKFWWNQHHACWNPFWMLQFRHRKLSPSVLLLLSLSCFKPGRNGAENDDHSAVRLWPLTVSPFLQVAQHSMTTGALSIQSCQLAKRPRCLADGSMLQWFNPKNASFGIKIGKKRWRKASYVTISLLWRRQLSSVAGANATIIGNQQQYWGGLWRNQ